MELQLKDIPVTSNKGKQYEKQKTQKNLYHKVFEYVA